VWIGEGERGQGVDNQESKGFRELHRPWSFITNRAVEEQRMEEERNGEGFSKKKKEEVSVKKGKGDYLELSAMK